MSKLVTDAPTPVDEDPDRPFSEQTDENDPDIDFPDPYEPKAAGALSLRLILNSEQTDENDPDIDFPDPDEPKAMDALSLRLTLNLPIAVSSVGGVISPRLLRQRPAARRRGPSDQ